MNAADPTREDQEIDQLLADTDGTIIASNVAESTVDKLRSELATLELALQQPASLDPYQKESACVRAVELVAAMGRDAESGSAKRPATAPQELGELGPYQLLEWLGQGGMGTVYKALHLRLDKLVAIKVLPTERLKSSDALGRFQREMKAVGKVDHPHLVRALDAGEANGTHYLVMEFVSGTDLGALLKQRGPLPVADACELIVQAAKGLHAAHSRGMVHRDIKPANLMLAVQEFGPPVVKVLDLGLALLADAHDATSDGLTGNSQIMGTIDYMAPEQAENSHSVDVRADVYSLGATLYALLTGGSIFADRPNQTLIQKLSALANEPAAPIRTRCGAVSEPLANIVHRMLSRKPGDRFASMAEVIAALQPFAAGSNLPGLLATDIGEPAGVRPRTIATQISGVSSNAATEAVRGLTPLGSPVRSGTGRTIRVAVAAAVAGVVLLGAILLSIKTLNGDVVVEVPDDLPAELRKEIKINVTGNGVAEVASEANGWKIGVKEGKYSVALSGGGDQVQIEDKQVTVSRNKKAIVTITLRPAGSAVMTNTTKLAAGTAADPAAERRIAEWVFGVKGQMTVRKLSGESLEVKSLKDLPQEPFTLTELFLCVGGNYNADEISNDDCRQFAALSGLEFLDLGRQPITAEGLAHFSGCRELKELRFFGSGIGVDAIPVVAKFTKLEKFMFQWMQSDTWAEALSKMPSLRSVTAYRVDFTDAGVAHLARLPKLENLTLSDCNLTDASLKSLATCKSLRNLHLCCQSMTWPEIKRLKQALPECAITDERLAEDSNYQFAQWLKTLPPPLTFDVTLADGSFYRVGPEQSLPVEPLSVQFVFLQGPALDQPGNTFFEEFAMRAKGLRFDGLQLSSAKLTSERAIKFLQLPEMSDLPTVAIRCDEVDDRVVECLASLKKLKSLDLLCPKMTGKGLHQLRALTSLSLYNATNVTAEGIEELKQLPKLVYLAVGGFRFTERHVDAITRLKLKHLLTNEAGFDDAMAARFAEMQTLEVLVFNKSPITDVGLPELKKLKELTALHLYGTKVTAVGVADLQQALPKCKIEWDAPKP